MMVATRLSYPFELGTNPDINTVNVNNRVQVALSSLPPEVQRQGIVVEKEVVSATGRHCILFAEAHSRSTLSVQLRHHQPARPNQRARQVLATRRFGAQRITRSVLGCAPIA